MSAFAVAYDGDKFVVTDTTDDITAAVSYEMDAGSEGRVTVAFHVNGELTAETDGDTDTND